MVDHPLSTKKRNGTRFIESGLSSLMLIISVISRSHRSSFVDKKREMDLSRAKRRRGAARESVSRLKESVDKLEVKAELSKTDRLLVSRLVKKLENWDAEFRKQHDVVLDLTEEDTTAIEREQAVFDEHDEKVTQLSLRLQVLGLEESEAWPASISDADISQHFEKRLCYMSGTLETIRDSVGRLVLGMASTIAFCKSQNNRSTSLHLNYPMSPMTYHARRTTNDP